MRKHLIIILFSTFLLSCSEDYPDSPEKENPNSNVFFYGADLSYVNEMEECGAVPQLPRSRRNRRVDYVQYRWTRGRTWTPVFLSTRDHDLP